MAFTLLLSPHLLARTITETDMQFPLDRAALEKGDNQIAVTLEGTPSFFAEHGIFEAADLFNISRFSRDKILAAKYAFIVKRGIESFSKNVIFNAQDFANISKNVRVKNEALISPTKIYFEISKRISLYQLTSKVELSHLDEKDWSQNNQENMKIRELAEGLPDGMHPQYVTLHRSYDFNNFFNEAMNLCYYQGVPGEEDKATLISCYCVTSIGSSTVRTLGFFVNFKSNFKSEILYSISKIKQGPDVAGEEDEEEITE